MYNSIRAIVCGGRSFANQQAIYEALDFIHSLTPISTLIHGAASGADTISGQWAADRGVNCIPVAANWERDGRSAGPIRNQKMLKMGADVVIAFPGGRGTDDMIRRARMDGIHVTSVTPSNPDEVA